jgi:hypothetical protein
MIESAGGCQLSRTQLSVGDLLWSTDPLDVVTVETLGDSAAVVITGRAGVFELSTFPRLLLPLHDLGRMVPLQRGGG